MTIDAALTAVVALGLPTWLLAEPLLRVANRYADRTAGLAGRAR